LNLLDLVIDHLDVLRDFLGGIDDLLDVAGRVLDDPLGAGGCCNAECDQ